MGEVGAVIVSTPQDIALKDAVKGITMFRKVDVPVHPSFHSPPPLSLRHLPPPPLSAPQISLPSANPTNPSQPPTDPRHDPKHVHLLLPALQSVNTDLRLQRREARMLRPRYRLPRRHPAAPEYLRRRGSRPTDGGGGAGECEGEGVCGDCGEGCGKGWVVMVGKRGSITWCRDTREDSAKRF